MLQQFGMESCKLLSTPIVGGDVAVASHLSLTPADPVANTEAGKNNQSLTHLLQDSSNIGGSDLMSNPLTYKQAISKLMYAMVATRPDLAFTISIASQHLAAPTNAHWQMLKRIF